MWASALKKLKTGAVLMQPAAELVMGGV